MQELGLLGGDGGDGPAMESRLADAPRAPGAGSERRASIVIKETGDLLNILQSDEKKSNALMAELEALLAQSHALSTTPAAAAAAAAAVSDNFASVRQLTVEDSGSDQDEEEEHEHQARDLVPEAPRCTNDAHRRRSSIVTMDSSALFGGGGAGWRLAGSAFSTGVEGAAPWPPSSPLQSRGSFTNQRARLASGKSWTEARAPGSMRRSSVTDVGSLEASGMLPHLVSANGEGPGNSGSGVPPCQPSGTDAADSPLKRRTSAMVYGSPGGGAPRSRVTDSEGDGLLGGAAAARATSFTAGSASGGRFMKILKGIFKPAEHVSAGEALDGYPARLRTPSISQLSGRAGDATGSMDGGALSGMSLAPRSHSVVFAARPAPLPGPAAALATAGLTCRSASMTARGGGLVRPPGLSAQHQFVGADAAAEVRSSRPSVSDRRTSGLVSFAPSPQLSAAAAEVGGGMPPPFPSPFSSGMMGSPGRVLLPSVGRSKSSITAASLKACEEARAGA